MKKGIRKKMSSLLVRFEIKYILRLKVVLNEIQVNSHLQKYANNCVPFVMARIGLPFKRIVNLCTFL